MTVMSCGLAKIWMEMSLLEMGVHLMILPTTSFRTMNATPYWCLESSPQYYILCSSSVVVSPTLSIWPRQGQGCPIDSVLIHKWAPVLFHRHVKSVHSMFLLLSFFWQSDSCFRSSSTLITPTLHGRCWSGPRPIRHIVSLLCFHPVLSVGLRKAWWRPSPLKVS